MAQETVNLTIPFTSLAEAIAALSLEDKRRLLELLEQQIAETEEDLWEQDPAVQAEIQEARAAYQAGDYVTLDEYTAQRQKKA